MNKDLIDEYREINVDYEWWADIYDDFVTEMRDVGIETSAKEMQFTGFWSQGDGASFTAWLYPDKFVAAHNMVEQFPTFPQLFEASPDFIELRINRLSSRYSHENTVRLDLEGDANNPYDDELDPVRHAMFNVWAEAFDVAKFEERARDICHSYMRDLYRHLEAEYEYLTSDEAVWDTLVANEMDEPEEEEDEDPEATKEEESRPEGCDAFVDRIAA